VTLPRVSIVINTWSLSSKPYLDLCIDSVKQLNYPKELLDVVLVGRKSYAPEYAGVKTVAPDSDEFGNELGQNFGVAHTNPESKHLFLINDDVFLTKNCLRNLVEAAGDQDLLLVPTSPCDNQWKYLLTFAVEHEGMHMILTDRFYRYEDLAPYAQSMINAESLYPSGLVLTDKLCLFAVLIPRSTWNWMGPMDEGFNTGQSDIDYSLRARERNIPRVIALNAIAWHFGGATSGDTFTDEHRRKNAEYFARKWPNEKL
jgi:GT2 family glycosyltransferase